MTSSPQKDVTIMRGRQTVDSLQNRHPSKRWNRLLQAAITSALHNKTLRIQSTSRRLGKAGRSYRRGSGAPRSLTPSPARAEVRAAELAHHGRGRLVPSAGPGGDL